MKTHKYVVVEAGREHNCNYIVVWSKYADHADATRRAICYCWGRSSARKVCKALNEIVKKEQR